MVFAVDVIAPISTSFPGVSIQANNIEDFSRSGNDTDFVIKLYGDYETNISGVLTSGQGLPSLPFNIAIILQSYSWPSSGTNTDIAGLSKHTNEEEIGTFSYTNGNTLAFTRSSWAGNSKPEDVFSKIYAASSDERDGEGSSSYLRIESIQITYADNTTFTKTFSIKNLINSLFGYSGTLTNLPTGAFADPESTSTGYLKSKVPTANTGRDIGYKKPFTVKFDLPDLMFFNGIYTSTAIADGITDKKYALDIFKFRGPDTIEVEFARTDLDPEKATATAAEMEASNKYYLLPPESGSNRFKLIYTKTTLIGALPFIKTYTLDTTNSGSYPVRDMIGEYNETDYRDSSDEDYSVGTWKHMYRLKFTWNAGTYGPGIYRRSSDWMEGAGTAHLYNYQDQRLQVYVSPYQSFFKTGAALSN